MSNRRRGRKEKLKYADKRKKLIRCSDSNLFRRGKNLQVFEQDQFFWEKGIVEGIRGCVADKGDKRRIKKGSSSELPGSFPP